MAKALMALKAGINLESAFHAYAFHHQLTTELVDMLGPQ
jgi:hypothetical protein